MVALDMRFLVPVVILTIGVAACTFDESPIPTAFRTDGTAKLQVCKGLGIEKCDYEPVEIPEFIDLRDPRWAPLRSEKKSSTRTMCYLDQPRGALTKRLLMFDCEPVFDQLVDRGPNASRPIPENLIKSLENIAEAAATFNVCADYYDDEVEISQRWTSYAEELGTLVNSLSEHYQDERLLLTYETRRAQLYDSEDFKNESLLATGYCDVESFRAGEQYVREAQSTQAPGALDE
jgi:hypothetical protein